MTLQGVEVNNESVLTALRVCKVTQAELARHAGYRHQSAVAAKLSGRVKWSAQDIRVVSLLCGLPMELFFGPIGFNVVAEDE